MGALMLLQAAETLLVAAHAAMNLLFLSCCNLIDPIRIGKQLTAHRCALDASACKLLLYKIRLIQSAHAGDGLVRILAHLVAEFQEAACSLKYGWLAGGMVSSRLEWFASVTWKLVTPASVSSGTKIPSSDSTTPALP